VTRVNRALTVVFAVAALLVSAVAAEARSAPPALAMKGTNGFKVLLSGEPGDGPDFVYMMAIRGNSTVLYETYGRVTARRIKGSFGPLGFASVRFRPEGGSVPRKGVNQCERTRVPLGSFLGKLRFRGESGFTRVEGTEGKAAAEPGGILACNEGIPTDGPGPWLVGGASGGPSFPFVRFTVSQGPPHELTVHSTSMLGQFRALRKMRLTAPAGAVSYGSGEVSLSPPPPFSGSATITAEPGPCLVLGRPSGTLSVTLPGAPPIALADGSISYYLQIPGGPQPTHATPCPAGY